MISRFSGLTDPNVIETIQIAWPDLLVSFAMEPRQAFQHGSTGGWAPVRFDPPKRAVANVREVFALVLDHDSGGRWSTIVDLWAGTAGVIYTTKSHGIGEGDRLRVVLPLSRPASVEEHRRLWDWAARRSRSAGCPVDIQCKDAARFWYEPTLPPGGYRSHLSSGNALDVDAALAEPVPPDLRVVQRPPTTATEREKRASAYLARIPGAVAGQSGHTATFNAVAHVMIGFDLDEATAERLIATEYNPRCSPPWSERELAHKIASVRATCTRERGYLLVERPRVASARQAAAHAPEAPDEVSADWTAQLLPKKDGSPRKAYRNTELFVRWHPLYRGKWSLDLMTGSPWFDGQLMPETFISEVRGQVEVHMGYTPSKEDVGEAILAAATARSFHPVVAYLRSVDWDGVPRLSEMARDYLGTDDATVAQMVRRWMISAVARAVSPGCKVDTALMLVGAQGIGKSTFFSILGGDWYSDSYFDISNRDGLMTLHSAWIYEFAELENVVHGRAESRLKAWMSSQADAFRMPYAKAVVSKPRGVVICGTTNRREFLTDDSGSRRFWIVKVPDRIPRETLEAVRDQLWGEAVAAYDAGEPWHLDDATDADRAAQNAEFEEPDVWDDLVAEYLAAPHREEVTVSQVLKEALDVKVDRQDRREQLRAARAIRAAGWERGRRREGGGVKRKVFRRPR